MRLVTFVDTRGERPGVMTNDGIVPLDEATSAAPPTIAALLAAGPEALAAAAAGANRARTRIALDTVRLCAPVMPTKFLGIGLNYRSHAEEVRRKGMPVPDDLTNQTWFNKQTSCVTGPFDTIHLPAVSEQLDYEGELGIVIGRRCRHVPAEHAREVIAGYLVVNDVSVRDWQKRSPTATLGKSFDTHGPIGPWLTTADAVADPEGLALRTWVDGTMVQEGSTSDLINGIEAMITYLSTVMTLMPGDVLATGTPAGVAQGRTPPNWLREGQVVRVEIDGLGHVENRVIAEPPSVGYFSR